jgi:hypothetical protein
MHGNERDRDAVTDGDTAPPLLADLDRLAVREATGLDGDVAPPRDAERDCDGRHG